MKLTSPQKYSRWQINTENKLQKQKKTIKTITKCQLKLLLYDVGPFTANVDNPREFIFSYVTEIRKKKIQKTHEALKALKVIAFKVNCGVEGYLLLVINLEFVYLHSTYIQTRTRTHIRTYTN